eukprot:TRINITY_DN1927_c0_g1_i1.p1 TRINITY_DN1927_c0_g1~~TRINITY_DN1927_c0_g1_i1.p1  ORF type:complete len:1217 (-),score=332.74 TRINITY_DN1927_c0_g1_i1:80-3730(-)
MRPHRVHIPKAGSGAALARSDSIDALLRPSLLRAPSTHDIHPQLARTVDRLVEDHNLLTSLFRHVADENALAEPLVSLLVAIQHAVPFILRLIQREVQATAHEETLFRTNSVATYCMSHFARKVGRSYLKSVVQPLIEELICVPVSPELDVNEIGELESLWRSAQFAKEGSRVLDRIMSTLHQVPTEMRDVCRALKSSCEEKFGPGAQGAQYSVAGFFFLRFLCPALLAPHLFHIIDQGVLTATQSRRLLLFGKLVQSLANDCEFTAPNMTVFNEMFVARNRTKMAAILDALAGPDRSGAQSMPHKVVKEVALSRAYEDLCDAVRSVDPKLVQGDLEKILPPDKVRGSLTRLKTCSIPFESGVSRKPKMASPPCTLFLQYSPYGPMLWLLLRSDWVLANALLDSAMTESRPEMAMHLVSLLLYSNEFDKYITEAVQEGLSRCGLDVLKAEGRTLFMLRAFVQVTCEDFFSDCLSPLIHELATDSRDMDVHLSHSEDGDRKRKLVQNAQNLCEALSHFWGALREELLCMPPVARRVLASVSKVCHNAHGEAGAGMVVLFLFHSIICPRIAVPKRHGMLVDAEYTPLQNRRLLIASKILQRLAKLSDTFESPTDYVAPLVQFLCEAIPSMRLLQRQLEAAEGAEGVARRRDSNVGARSLSLASCADLFSFLSEHRADVQVLHPAMGKKNSAHMVADQYMTCMFQEVLEHTSRITSGAAARVQLYVFVGEATIPSTDTDKHSSFYCEVFTDHLRESEKRVLVCKTRPKPTTTWMERFTLFQESMSQLFIFEVYSKEKLLSDTFIGRATVDCGEVQRNLLTPLTLDVRRGGQRVGSLSVMVEVSAETAHGFPMTEYEWDQLAVTAVQLAFDAGDTLRCVAEDSHNFYRVSEGCFEVMENGRHMGYFELGDVIGAQTILLGTTNAYQISATTTPSALERYPLKSVMPMLDSKPELMRRFYYHVAMTLRRQLLQLDGKRLADKAQQRRPTRKMSLERSALTTALRTASKKPATDMVAVNEFPCKLGRKGILYIVHDSMMHFSRLLGMEKKILIPFADIRSSSCRGSSLLLEMASGKKRHLSFTSEEDCATVSRMLENVTRCQAGDDDTQQGTRFGRALVLRNFEGKGEGELRLSKDDTIFVMDADGDTWSGSKDGRVGTFPKQYVPSCVCPCGSVCMRAYFLFIFEKSNLLPDTASRIFYLFLKNLICSLFFGGFDLFAVQC